MVCNVVKILRLLLTLEVRGLLVHVVMAHKAAMLLPILISWVMFHLVFLSKRCIDSTNFLSLNHWLALWLLHLLLQIYLCQLLMHFFHSILISLWTPGLSSMGLVVQLLELDLI